MDWLMLVLLTCTEGSDCEPEMLQRPAEWTECEEQSRVLEAGYRLVTEWQGEMRGIAASTCIPMEIAVERGMVGGGEG
jgi:hypothetical protein